MITIVTNRVFILSPALKGFQNLWSYARSEFKQSELMIEEIKIDEVCAKIVQLTILAQTHIFGSEAISFSICQVFVYSLLTIFALHPLKEQIRKLLAAPQRNQSLSCVFYQLFVFQGVYVYVKRHPHNIWQGHFYEAL